MNDKMVQLETLLNDEEVISQLEDMSTGGLRPSPEADAMMDMIIADCGGGTECTSVKKLDNEEITYSVSFLADNLPAVQFVAQFYLELIVHGGLVAKDKSNQKILDNWLLSENILGQSNSNVIRQAVLDSIIYGYSGLRKIGDGVVYISPDHFKIWNLPAYMIGVNGRARPVPGITKPFLYQITKKPNTVEGDKGAGDMSYRSEEEAIEDLNLEEGVDGSLYPKAELPNDIAQSEVYVKPKNFCHLRHSDEGEYGVSPLTKDRLRTTLIIDYIKNVIDEVGNDGVDYMLYLKARNNIGTSLAGMVSNSAASAMISAAVDAKNVKSAQEKSMEAARDLALKMKRSRKTRMNLINSNFVDRVERLPGTVELYRYLTVLNDAKGVVADIYGIPALLAGSSGGGWSTGMSSLIPFTLERTIKPFAKRYSEQLQNIISACSGVKGQIHFAEIDATDQKTMAELEKMASETKKNIEEANRKHAEYLQMMLELEQMKKGTDNSDNDKDTQKGDNNN